MNSLQARLRELKQQYDAERLRILDEFAAGVESPAPPVQLQLEQQKPGPVVRAGINRKYTAEEVEQALAQIIEAIRAGGPSGKEGLRKNLGLEDKLLNKALALGTESDQLSIVGERRASKYVIPSAGQREGRVKKRTAK